MLRRVYVAWQHRLTEGRRPVEIILAIYKSAETGKAVKLPLASDPALKTRRKKVLTFASYSNRIYR